MEIRVNGAVRSFRTGASSASTPFIIWGLTPRKSISASRAAAALSAAVRQPSSAARRTAFSAVRLVTRTSCAGTVLQRARARAEPILPTPMNPKQDINFTAFPGSEAFAAA